MIRSRTACRPPHGGFAATDAKTDFAIRFNGERGFKEKILPFAFSSFLVVALVGSTASEEWAKQTHIARALDHEICDFPEILKQVGAPLCKGGGAVR